MADDQNEVTRHGVDVFPPAARAEATAPAPSVDIEELLDEESLAVLAILLAVALEFGFGFGKYIVWWSGLLAAPTAMAALIALFRWRRSRGRLVASARWVLGRSRR